MIWWRLSTCWLCFFLAHATLADQAHKCDSGILSDHACYLELKLARVRAGMAFFWGSHLVRHWPAFQCMWPFLLVVFVFRIHIGLFICVSCTKSVDVSKAMTAQQELNCSLLILTATEIPPSSSVYPPQESSISHKWPA